LADQKISELTALTGANVADDDAIAIVDTSATETKKIVFSELKNALDTATGFVRITGDTMTGALDVQSTITADGLTVDGNIVLDGILQLKDSGGSARSVLDYSASDDVTISTGTSSGARSIYMITEGNNALRVHAGGDISFYEDTGTTAKFFWDASAESLGLGATSFSGETLRMERSGDMILGLFSGASNSTFLNMGTTSNRDAGQIGYTQSSNHMFFRVNDAEAMRIDSSGNVGIGVAPSTKLHVKNGTNQNFNVFGPAVFSNGVTIASTADGFTGYLEMEQRATQFAWHNGTTERMRIDSSGNLLVGATSSNYGAVGSQIGTGGNNYMTRSGAQPLLLNRLTSDGDIAAFYKDAAPVGSVGSNAGAHLTMGSGDTGLLFNASTDKIHPWNMSTQGVRDNAVDLGVDVSRFKDLYLSGGVYLGGTGAANKLDDYEEGTWTPTLPNGGTISVSRATYTKTGRFVHVQFQADLTPTNNSSQFRIGGLPFVTTSVASSYSVGSLGYSGGLDVSGWQQPIVQHSGSDFLYFQLSTGSTADVLNSAFAGSTRNFVISANYETN
jgi:hypothetical protein